MLYAPPTGETNYPILNEAFDRDIVFENMYLEKRNAMIPHRPGKFRPSFRFVNQLVCYNLDPRAIENKPSETTGNMLMAFLEEETAYSSPEYFSIKLNHGGNIVRDIIEYYVGGTVSYVDYCDNDLISRIELQSMSKEVGYVEEVALFYKVQSNGKWVFKKIETDGDVTTMVQSLRNGLVEVFITDSNLEGLTSVEYNANVDVEDGLLDIDITSWEWDCGSFSQDNYNYLDFTTHTPSSRPNPPSTIDPLSTNEPPPTTRRRNARRRPVHHDSDSESDPDVFIDSDYEFSEDDDALFDANVDKDIEWCGVRQKKVVGSDIPHNCLSETESEEGDSSDGFMSFDSSSDEDRKDKPKFRKYRPVLGKVQPIIEEKMIFKNRAQCVEAIRQHAIVNGKAITFEKNDTDRVRAHCLAPCPWNILASSITGDSKTLQVKTLNLNNKQCGWNWTSKLINSSWLSRTYFKEFKIDPSWPVTQIVERVMADYIVKISPQMAYNARKKAVKKIEGSYAEQYEKLWDYCIPCAHALAVLRESKKKAEGLVHEYYQKQAYINTYKHVIYPMNGMDMWEKTNKPPIHPPHYTRKSGRPKKCRRREPDEPPAQSDGTKKMKRYLNKLSCRRCGGKAHNVRTCPSGFTAPRSKEQQCSQPISQPMFTLPSQPSQPTPKAPCRRGGIATRGGATRKGGATRRGAAP
ncbi:hypothetical protein RHGRI_032030 [Rhododendron griersonianum]|uniref:Transposase MuDR plant domain-containing protein n=1 Tax=Rhododendron griersonianum TaxID=479676 RepID=A0AAV6IG15_9ERIC|nr:hypothetical protein RHGRI_032030 [Rhododendron griersonianum]